MEPWKERTNILLGEERIAKLQNATVAVIGLEHLPPRWSAVQGLGQ